jgi:hypothetical protein
MRVARFVRWSLAVTALFALAWSPLPAAGTFVGLSVKVLNESVPPGGVAQMKVTITEPKPISTGRGDMFYGGFDMVDGIALISPADDTVGVARVLGHQIELALHSPSGTYGQTLDYPVLTIAGHVPANTPLGSTFLFSLDASTLFSDPAGAPYPMELTPGLLTVEKTMSIDDVRPGSADLPAGASVQIFGTNFTPKTEIRLDEVKVRSQRFINANEIDIVLGSTARMHGMHIKAKDSGGTTAEYFAYQRTKRDGESVDPEFVGLIPVFPRRSTISATIDLAGDNAGIGLQNIGDTTATVTAELLNADGTLLSTATLDLGSNRYVTRNVMELFHVAYAPGLTVRLSATAPIQAMGIAVTANRYASPIVAK